MKTRTAFFVATVMAVVLVAGAGLIAAQSNISPDGTRTAAVILTCHNYGGQQDVAKNPDIINSTKKPLPAGKTLYWKSTDGDSGSVVLDHALPVGGKIKVNGKPGQSYKCSAWTTQ